MKIKRTAVVGAGIAGLTAAYYLAKRGHFVTVFDQDRYPAMQTSYANAGQLSASNSEVWNTWSNVWKGAKWMLKKDAPLLIRPDLDIDKAIWLTKFLWHTAKATHIKNTIATLKMALDSRQHLQNLLDAERIEFDFARSGILHFYKDQKYLDDAVSMGKIYAEHGCEWQQLDADGILEIEPTLGHAPDIIGGFWTPSDLVGDAHKFCTELAKILDDRYNVDFVFDTKIDHLGDDLDLYDNIVVAAGYGSVKLAKTIGDRLPIYPVKGYSITVTLDNEQLEYAPAVSILDDQAKIAASRLGNRFRVAGTAELAGENYDIRRDRIEPLLRWIDINFPHVNTSNYSSWACLRPMTPDMMPIVCQSSRQRNVWYHTGHGHLGWTLGLNTADQLVRSITDVDNN